MEIARNNCIDAAKLFAAFGVVMIHLTPSTPAAETISRIFLNFVVPFFLTIALYFFINKASRVEQLNVFQLNWDRIVVPYSVWTLVYLAFRFIKYRVQHKPFHLELAPTFIYGGTGVQMYFLPLLLLFQAQALALLMILQPPPKRGLGIFVLIIASVFGYFGSRESYFGFQDCFERGCMFVLLAFLLRYSQSYSFGRQTNVFGGLIIAGLTIVATFIDYRAAWWSYVGEPLAGYSIAALTLNLKLAPTGPVWRFVLTCSYGIFLSHFLLLEAFQFACAKLSFQIPPFSVLTKSLTALFIVSCCVLLVWIIRLNRIAAYLLLGEAPRPRGTLPAPSKGLAAQCQF